MSRLARYASSARAPRKPDVSIAVCRPIRLAAASMPPVKPICTSGSPPEMVRPPSMAPQHRCEVAPSADHCLRQLDMRAVLEMPGIGVVAVASSAAGSPT